jgi:hypothetical protein
MDMKQNTKINFLSKDNLTKFNFLSKYERFGIVSLIVLIASITLVFADISANMYTACIITIAVLTLFFSYRIYLMPAKTTIQQLISRTFTMLMTILILISYTVFCVSDVDNMDDMPSEWYIYAKVFMSIVLVQSIIGVYTLFLTTESNHWIFCSIGAIFNILLFIFLLFVYTIYTNFRTDGFLV